MSRNGKCSLPERLDLIILIHYSLFVRAETCSTLSGVNQVISCPQKWSGFSARNWFAFQVLQNLTYLSCQIFGVATLHGANILHRDLKLANLFIKADGHLCIGDFGMAVTFEEDSKPVARDSFAGTTTHLAPEIWSGCGYTPAADWWAVGVNVYQMFHGDVSLLTSFVFRSLNFTRRLGVEVFHRKTTRPWRWLFARMNPFTLRIWTLQHVNFWKGCDYHLNSQSR